MYSTTVAVTTTMEAAVVVVPHASEGVASAVVQRRAVVVAVREYTLSAGTPEVQKAAAPAAEDLVVGALVGVGVARHRVSVEVVGAGGRCAPRKVVRGLQA